MKNLCKTSFISALFLVFLGNSIQAQFLDKLKKSVEEKVEKVIIDKTSDKAAQKTDKTLDKVFDVKLGGDKQAKKITLENIPISFEFNYQYRLTITTAQGKNKMNMDYFLKPKATYMGTKVDQMTEQEVFMIMDGQANINYMFIESGDNKIVTATSIDGDEIIVENQDYNYDAYTFTDLHNKTFLGYNCKGKKMENNEYLFIMYFTNEAPISFNDVFKTDTDRMPEAIKNQFKEGENGTMMYMEMKDKLNKGKKDKSGTMECTLMEAKSFTFNTTGYKFM
jgi:hypothetical protein